MLVSKPESYLLCISINMSPYFCFLSSPYLDLKGTKGSGREQIVYQGLEDAVGTTMDTGKFDEFNASRGHFVRHDVSVLYYC